MKRIAIVNGPNLNLLGKREPEIYGSQSFESYFELLKTIYQDKCALTYFQSNVEGELINYIQQIGFSYDAILLNAGGYTHTSVALADAVAAVTAPVIEIHISNIFARESFRHVSYLSKHCKGIISGLGLNGYKLAIEHCLDHV